MNQEKYYPSQSRGIRKFSNVEFRKFSKEKGKEREAQVNGKVAVFVNTGNGETKNIDARLPSIPDGNGEQGYWQCLKRADCPNLKVKPHIKTTYDSGTFISHFAHNGKYHSPPFTILPF